MAKWSFRIIHRGEEIPREEVDETLSEIVRGYGYWQGPAWFWQFSEIFDVVEMEKQFAGDMTFLTRYGRMSEAHLLTCTRQQRRRYIEALGEWLEKESEIRKVSEM